MKTTTTVMKRSLFQYLKMHVKSALWFNHARACTVHHLKILKILFFVRSHDLWTVLFNFELQNPVF